jgi:hypothetical protein
MKGPNSHMQESRTPRHAVRKAAHGLMSMVAVVGLTGGLLVLDTEDSLAQPSAGDCAASSAPMSTSGSTVTYTGWNLAANSLYYVEVTTSSAIYTMAVATDSSGAFSASQSPWWGTGTFPVTVNSDGRSAHLKSVASCSLVVS